MYNAIIFTIFSYLIKTTSYRSLIALYHAHSRGLLHASLLHFTNLKTRTQREPGTWR